MWGIARVYNSLYLSPPIYHFLNLKGAYNQKENHKGGWDKSSLSYSRTRSAFPLPTYIQSVSTGILNSFMLLAKLEKFMIRGSLGAASGKIHCTKICIEHNSWTIGKRVKILNIRLPIFGQHGTVCRKLFFRFI